MENRKNMIVISTSANKDVKVVIGNQSRRLGEDRRTES